MENNGYRNNINNNKNKIHKITITNKNQIGVSLMAFLILLFMLILLLLLRILLLAILLLRVLIAL